ncbi:MAG: substrate-binding domain-containing protein [Opitutae bacterium]|nr:substrate-binding domain-containing protein [Opitutae bacterium]
MKISHVSLSLSVAFALALSASAQTVLRFAGATTLEKAIKPIAGAIGQTHKVTIELVPNGAGRGLEDLVAGKAQVAMLAGSLTNFAAQINGKKPGTIDPEKLKVHPLFEMGAVVIVHPSNPVASLTHEQIRGLFSGKITNWKEVGGPDTPVLIVISAPSDGVRSVVTEKIMADTAYAATARMFQTSPEMNKVVAQVPGAVAMLSEKNAAPEVRAIKPAQPILVPYSLISIGEPTEPIKSIIAEIQTRLK